MTRAQTDRWFVDHVLPLEAELMRFLRRSWRNPGDLADLRQETLVRAYEAGLRETPLQTRPFVYTIARNLMTDRLRRARVVSIDFVEDLAGLNVLSEEPRADEIVSAREQLQQFAAAAARLPPRCREVMMLRKVEGLSQREVALRLGITEDTVERQVSKAMRALATALVAAAPLNSEHELPDWLRRSRWRRR